jgi:phospholipase C
MTPEEKAHLSRRELLLAGAGLAGTAGAAALLGQSAIARAATNLAPHLPRPNRSGIEHVVVVMMENRSFDHLLGWLPNANGVQAGLSYVDEFGVTHTTAHFAGFQGCGHPDPDHSYEGGRVQYANGACDGFLLGRNDQFAISYYTDADLAFYRNAAPYWTTCDRYFASIMAATYPNRFYMHSGQTDRLHNGDGVFPTTLPTIWDRLAEASISRKYYYSDVPFIALWGGKYLDIAHPLTDFLADCESGDLPAVSFLDPRFFNEELGTAGDDHPHSDLRVGQAFLNQVYEAITNSPAWKNTVFVINYDEWGGFFDHVAPGLGRDANPLCRLRGFRVPCIVISPFARRHHVAHHTYDHTSILRMIEWRWGLAPLALRDAHARNLAEVLDFTSPDLTAPSWDVPSRVGLPCPEVDPAEFAEWTGLRDHAVREGFRLP